MGRKVKDLTGMEFGYLKVLCKSEKDDASSHTFWWCRCTRCDSIVDVRSDKLLDGRAISCGCWRKNRWKNGKITPPRCLKMGKKVPKKGL